jgi:DNA repair exonuclease SbcCD nuclease subunit
VPEYLLMGDLHLSDRPPSSCTDTYQDDIVEILRAVGEIARDRGSHAIFWAGDVFHHKTPGRTSHKTVKTVIELIRSYPCPVLVVPGNHDMQNDRLDSIDSTQPLGVLWAADAVRLAPGGWIVCLDGDAQLYSVPWLQRFTDDTLTEALGNYHEFVDRDRPALVVTHAPLYPLGQELIYEHYPADKWAAAMGDHGSVYYGHVHEPHGIHTAGGVTFCNAGAISRGSLHEHNLTRPVQIAAWDSATGRFELLDVPHKPAGEVFRLVQAQQARTAQLELDRFLDSIGQTSIEVTSIESVMAHIRGLQLGESLEQTILSLLEEATA